MGCRALATDLLFPSTLPPSPKCCEDNAPFRELVQSAKADKREADADNTIRAIAEALQLVIQVGTDTHVQLCGANNARRSRATWSRC